jgi:hypothetical protein
MTLSLKLVISIAMLFNSLFKGKRRQKRLIPKNKAFIIPIEERLLPIGEYRFPRTYNKSGRKKGKPPIREVIDRMNTV